MWCFETVDGGSLIFVWHHTGTKHGFVIMSCHPIEEGYINPAKSLILRRYFLVILSCSTSIGWDIIIIMTMHTWIWFLTFLTMIFEKNIWYVNLQNIGDVYYPILRTLDASKWWCCVGRGKSSGRIRVKSFQEKSGRVGPERFGVMWAKNFLLLVYSRGDSLQYYAGIIKCR